MVKERCTESDWNGLPLGPNNYNLEEGHGRGQFLYTIE
jgi:hypothetical protein